MWEKVQESIESIFEVKQTKYTGKRIFFTFCLVVLMAFSLPMYFRYEAKVHHAYATEYQQVKAWTVAYYQQHGNYPVKEQVALADEKDLAVFFETYHLDENQDIYYLQQEKWPHTEALKYTYVINVNQGTLFTTEYVIYHMRRMHIPGY